MKRNLECESILSVEVFKVCDGGGFLFFDVTTYDEETKEHKSFKCTDEGRLRARLYNIIRGAAHE